MNDEPIKPNGYVTVHHQNCRCIVPSYSDVIQQVQEDMAKILQVPRYLLIGHARELVVVALNNAGIHEPNTKGGG